MSKKRRLFAGLPILIAMLFAATGCYKGVRVGDLLTRSQTVERDDAGSVDVQIEMGAGQLDVAGGASELLEASFTYNVEELNPRATYANGRLEVRDSGVSIGLASLADLNDYRCEWDLKLNEDVPMAMNINLGAGPSRLALGSLALTRLDVHGGAGEVTIDLTGGWRQDFDASISGGLGDINLRLPGNVGIRVDVSTGIGHVDISGLTRDGDIYTNDAYGVSDITLRIDIDAGVGEINLDVDQD